ncbi:MAG: hypothetical protein AB8G86_12135 [Saprospiraceae bacterium]
MRQDYLFLADLDFNQEKKCFLERKKQIATTYKLPDINKIWIVTDAIESWFLAGFNKSFCDREKLSFKQNTEKINKEVFDKLEISQKRKRRKSHDQLIDLLIRKKDDFTFQEVIEGKRNESLARFYTHYNLVC